MATSADCPAEELEWTIMAAAHMLSPLGIALQSPPNLSRPQELRRLLSLGVSDWGGVSPVTADYVNPELPWPVVDELRALTESSGHRLVPRLPAYPRLVSGFTTGGLLLPAYPRGYARLAGGQWALY